MHMKGLASGARDDTHLQYYYKCVTQGSTALTDPRGLDHPPQAGRRPAGGGPDRLRDFESLVRAKPSPNFPANEGSPHEILVSTGSCEGKHLLCLDKESLACRRYSDYVCAVKPDRQPPSGGFVKGSKLKEAVPVSDNRAPDLDPAQANKSGPQLDSESAHASVEGPLATLNSAENQELAPEQLSEATAGMIQNLTNQGLLQIIDMLPMLRRKI